MRWKIGKSRNKTSPSTATNSPSAVAPTSSASTAASAAAVSITESDHAAQISRQDSRALHPDLVPYFIFGRNSTPDDPSYIDTDLPIEEPQDDLQVGKLPYYPSYINMDPRQRWRYLLFLQNPYDPISDIGYVFVLYYGLEKWLMTSFYRDVIRIIEKLRKSHCNQSFYAYSASAFTASCLMHDDLALLTHLITSGALEGLSDSVLLYSMKLCGLSLSAEFIMKTHSSWGFSNGRYIKMYPDRFLYLLRKNIKDAQDGQDSISLVSYGDNTKRSDAVFFANYSIDPQQRAQLMPDLFEDVQLKKLVHELLARTHEELKLLLAAERKKN